MQYYRDSQLSHYEFRKALIIASQKLHKRVWGLKMNINKLLLLAFSLAFTWGHCQENRNQESQITGFEMNYSIEEQQDKFFIGLELRTNNEECSLTMPTHQERFFYENIPAKIPNRIDGNILALYTDYEGDYTKPYSWILGCEVSSLNEIPVGLVGKVIPKSKYAVFTTQGEFPQGLIAVWQNIWQSNLSRSYTSDFELYRSDFDPQKNPEVKVYIALDDAKNSLLHSVRQGG
jgi:predicted transcriptional regulator YdeE